MRHPGKEFVMPDFLPSREADLLPFASNFSAKITATPEDYGFVAADATARTKRSWYSVPRDQIPHQFNRYSSTTGSFSSTPMPGRSESVIHPSRATASPMNNSDRNVSPSR